MMNKRHFLKGSAAALAAGTGAATAVASTPRRLDAWAGAAIWAAHVGQRFEVDGHAVTLTAVDCRAGPGEQFSLRFAGDVPASVGDSLHGLKSAAGTPLALYLARTAQGLRADICRLAPG